MRLHNAIPAILFTLGLSAIAYASPVTYTTSGTLQKVSGDDLLGLDGATFTATNTLDTTQSPRPGTTNQYDTTLVVDTSVLDITLNNAIVTINYVGANSSSNNITVQGSALGLTATTSVLVPSIPGTAPAPIVSTTLVNPANTLTISSGSAQSVYTFSSGTISSNPAGTGCTITPSPTSITFPSAASEQSVTVTASSSTCTWSVTSDSSWLHASPTSGTGSGSFTASADANPLTVNRIGHLTVGSTTITVTQTGLSSCTFTFSPTSLSFDDAGGSQNLTITPSSSTCTWTATSSQTWLTIAPNTGTGTLTVSVTAASNTSTSDRSATITVGGQSLTVTQSGVSPCDFTVDPTAITFPAAGSSSPISITASAGTCTWQATSSVSWVTLNPTSGTGTGSVTATAASNTNSVTSRTGTLTIAGKTVTVTQEPDINCTFTVSPTSLFVSGSGGSDMVTVTPNNEACPWTTSSSTSWLSVTPPSATGTGEATIVSAVNTTGVQRVGSVTIAGQSVQVTQSNVAGCSYLLSPSSISVDSAGGQEQTVTVSASSSSCQWGVEVPGWITSSISNGTGSGSVVLTISENTTGIDRTTNIVIGPQSLPATQRFTAKRFDDVLPTDYYFNAVNLLANTGVTNGCSTSLFCPTTAITRAEMAVFLVRGLYGSDDFTYSDTPYFTDVTPDTFGFAWIQELKELGITNGCGNNMYCPTGLLPRDQAASLVIRTRYGPTANLTYPAIPYFSDVPDTYWAFPQIQRMKLDGITGGCGPTLFCPSGTVTRGDMAVFIERGLFNQLLLPSVPVLTSVSPNVLTQGQTQTVTITGTNTSFSPGVTQIVAIPGVTFGAVTVNSPTMLTVDFTVDSAAAVQPQPVHVITGTEEVVMPNGIQITPGIQ